MSIRNAAFNPAATRRLGRTSVDLSLLGFGGTATGRPQSVSRGMRSQVTESAAAHQSPSWALRMW